MPFGPWPGSLAGGGAAAEQAQILLGIVPGMQFSHVKPNDLEQASPGATPIIGANDASILGGGTFPVGPSYVTLSGTIYTDLLTQAHGWAARAMINPPGGGFYTSIGPSFNTHGASSVYTRLSAYNPYDATHLCIEFFRPGAGGSTVVPTSFVIDGLEHWYALALDVAGTWHALVDGIEVGSTIDISNVVAGDRCWAGYQDIPAGATNLAIGELIYGWLPPSLLATPEPFSIRMNHAAIGYIGDSYTQGFPDPSFRWQAPLEASITQKFRTANAGFPTHTNLGVGGDTSTDVLARLAALIAAGCDHYFHLYGLNDKFNHGGAPILPVTTQANYTAILTGLLTALPNSKHHVLSNLWFDSEQRPRGIGPNDATTDASNGGIQAAVALQPATSVRYLDLIPRIYTSLSPVINPTNANGGFLTQADRTHPSKTAGQNVISRCVFDFLTFSK